MHDLSLKAQEKVERKRDKKDRERRGGREKEGEWVGERKSEREG